MAHIIIGLNEKNRMRKRAYSSVEAQEKEALSRRKEYKPSQWCRDMTKAAIRATDSKGNFNPGSAFKEQLHNHKGAPKVPNHAKADLRAKGHRI